MAMSKERLEKLTATMEKTIRDAFLAAIQDIVDNVVLQRLIDAITVGDIQSAFDAIGFHTAALNPFVTALEQTYAGYGSFTASTFPKLLTVPTGKIVFRFDIRNPRAESWLRQKSSSEITKITNEVRSAVQTSLEVGMSEGRNPRSVALDIVGRIDPATKQRVGGIIGLADNQRQWVNSARNSLESLDKHYFSLELRDKRFDSIVQKAIDEGKPLPSDTVTKLVDRYKTKALRWRGENIARTEALEALNASEYEANYQVVELGAAKAEDIESEWDSAGDGRVRRSHALMDGQKRKLGEAFVSPVTQAKMLYPGDRSLGAPANETILCRCRLKTKIDWLKIAAREYKASLGQ